jgi:hypothetical protein
MSRKITQSDLLQWSVLNKATKNEDAPESSSKISAESLVIDRSCFIGRIPNGLMLLWAKKML